MTQEQIVLIKKSWRIVRLIEPTLIADTFYTKLFADNKRLRKMFPEDMELQYTKLMDMLGAIIMRLDHIEEFTEDIQAMAIRHAQYGVKPTHYTLVGNALLWTLKQGLGNDWQEATAEAWATCYTFLAKTMIDAAYMK